MVRKFVTRTFAGLAALSVGLGMIVPAHAAVVLIGQFEGTECGGKGGFSNCYAYPGGTTQGFRSDGSPAVFKYNSDGSKDFSTAYPTVTGSEFVINYTALSNTLGFTYTPGTGDPTLHYFAVKQADGFALFYDANPILSGSVNLSTYFPNNPGFSHITFFNSGSMGAVPEPATWAMMLLGFGFMGGAMRSTKRRQTLNVSYA